MSSAIEHIREARSFQPSRVSLATICTQAMYEQYMGLPTHKRRRRHPSPKVRSTNRAMWNLIPKQWAAAGKSLSEAIC
ncbi:protein of unknown function [Burkholderia multivorans]